MDETYINCAAKMTAHSMPRLKSVTILAPPLSLLKSKPGIRWKNMCTL